MGEFACDICRAEFPDSEMEAHRHEAIDRCVERDGIGMSAPEHPLHPTPWALVWDYQTLALNDAKGDEIATWTYAISTHPAERYEAAKAECDTDAADLILVAVNSHSALVEGMTFLMNCRNMDVDEATWNAAMEQAQAARDLATGRDR